MIIAKTKLKKIPYKCNNCKFCVNVDVGRKSSREDNYMAISYMRKKCYITGNEVPYVYNKIKRNWEYTKCNSCPLMDNA